MKDMKCHKLKDMVTNQGTQALSNIEIENKI